MAALKFIQGLKSDAITSSVASLLPPLSKATAHGPRQRIQKFKATDKSEMEFFTFKDLDPALTYIKTAMYVPKYFDGNTEEIRGMFLLEVIGMDDLADNIFQEKLIGRQGCGYHINIGEDGLFTFNGFTYHPFILRNLAVCYYRCETKSNFNKKWCASTEPGVAIESKIHYDHGLDIFLTEDAERKPLSIF